MDSTGQDIDEAAVLHPFEMQNIDGEYRKYYATRRNNFFASIQGFPDLWEYYRLLDNIWLREINDLEVPSNMSSVFPLMLYMNAHAKLRIGIELAFGTNLGEARSILRDAVEYVAHAHHMLKDPELQKSWLNKDTDDKAFSKAFEHNKKVGLFNGLAELHEKWGQLSELGSHANPSSLSQQLVVEKRANGSRHFCMRYTGSRNSKMTELSIFSLLLTCFVLEDLFFSDYKVRLELDDTLMQMRLNFAKYKEELRQKLITKHNIQPPTSKP